jgi:hypothetical protein
MANYVKYQEAVADIHTKKHDFSADAFKFALTNQAPVVGTDNVLLDISEIAAGNGYTAGGGAVVVASAVQVGGVFTLATTTDVVFTASGGSIGPFRYVVLYNSTPAGGLLVSYWDRGSSLTLLDGEDFTVDVTDKLFEAV